MASFQRPTNPDLATVVYAAVLAKDPRADVQIVDGLIVSINAPNMLQQDLDAILATVPQITGTPGTPVQIGPGIPDQIAVKV